MSYMRLVALAGSAVSSAGWYIRLWAKRDNRSSLQDVVTLFFISCSSVYQTRLLLIIPQTPKADPDRRLARLSRRRGAMIGFVMEACQGGWAALAAREGHVKLQAIVNFSCLFAV
jgi:hypothetical protein